MTPTEKIATVLNLINDRFKLVPTDSESIEIELKEISQNTGDSEEEARLILAKLALEEDAIAFRNVFETQNHPERGYIEVPIEGRCRIYKRFGFEFALQRYKPYIT